MNPRVAVIILNWNGREDTLECLESVTKLDYPNFQITVVDNGSSDRSVVTIRERFPRVTVLETGSNLGYAGGNNFGIREMIAQGAQYLFILNNDTIVDPQIVKRFMEAARENPSGAIFGARVYSYEDHQKILFDGAVEVSAKAHYYYLSGHEGETTISPRLGVETPFVAGSAFMFPACLTLEVGLMDERYFLYFEEADFCSRVRKKGYEIYVVPRAKVFHKVSRSMGGANSPLQSYFMTRNHLLWAQAHGVKCAYSRLLRQTMRAVLAPGLEFGVKEAIQDPRKLYWSSRRFIAEWQKPSRWASAIGLRDYIFGRLGDCPDIVRRWNKMS